MRPLLLLLAGCAAAPTTDQTETDEPAPPLTIADLWSGEVAENTWVTVDGVVISQPTVDGAAFYVQQAGGGPESGLEVMLGDGTISRVPPIGTPVRLTGQTTSFSRVAPDLWLKDEDDLRVIGQPVDPVRTPWDPEAALTWCLVSAADVTVTTAVDPAGIAWTDLGRHFRPDFGVPSPGWNRTGGLVAIPSLADSILLRDPADWSGELDPDPPVPTTIEALADLPDGTPVLLHDLVQATPWSVGGRHAVLQDATGAGVWVDAEGFGAPDTAPGDLGTWFGAIIRTGEGLRLRVWEEPDRTDAGKPITFDNSPTDAPDGALVDVVLSGLGPVGGRGERGATGWLVDNRFREVESLQNGDRVLGAVRVDSGGTRRLAVLR